MAVGHQTPRELQAEIDAMRHELDAIETDRVMRLSQCPVFFNLFLRKEYLFRLFREQFAQDGDVTEDDLELLV